MSTMTTRQRPSTLLDSSEAVPAGYKKTEVGIVPQDWEVRQLGELFDFSGGHSASRRQLSDVGHCHLHYGDIHGSTKTSIDTRADYVRIPKLNIPLRDVSPESLLEDGDVVFVDASEDDEGASKHVVVVNEDRLPFISGLHTIVAKGKTDELIHEYRHYCFQTGSIRSQFLYYAVGTKVTGISKSNIPKLLLPLPKPEEQRAIAEALSDVDGLLGALEALIGKKRAIKQAAMQRLLTGKTRLPGFSGEWETKRLGDLVTFLRHGVNSRSELTDDGPVRYLHYGDIHTCPDVGLDPRLNRMPRLPAARARGLDRLQDGDLVLVDASEDLEGIGKSVEITGASECEIVAGLHTIAARFDKAALADGFKAYLQFCPAFRDQLRRLAAGTKVYATNRAHLASVEMQLPGADEQTAIATVLSDMNAEIAALERRRDKTRAIKQGMMQQLLTGRIRLVESSNAEAATC